MGRQSAHGNVRLVVFSHVAQRAKLVGFFYESSCSHEQLWKGQKWIWAQAVSGERCRIEHGDAIFDRLGMNLVSLTRMGRSEQFWNVSFRLPGHIQKYSCVPMPAFFRIITPDLNGYFWNVQMVN